ncbi:MAG: bifunctional riboflavin kinase/FAD synthetase [Bacteroidota bacterium]
MRVVRQLSEILYEKNSVVTVGSFDGVHRAHREIIAEVVERARTLKGRSVVLTFDPHPREVLGSKRGPFKLLTTLEERRAICEELGVDLFFVIAFDFAFSRQSSRDFYMKYLVNGIGVSEVIEGYDHHFGRDREGSVEEMLHMGKEFNFSIVALKPVVVEGTTVSSSEIRNLLESGDVEKAALFLGRPYALRGTVVEGDKRGRELGYPTANIRPVSTKKLLPKDGIYFVAVSVGGRKKYGMASIGVRPTFHDDGDRTVEVNILDFDASIYGQEVEIQMLKRLRDELKFGSAEELVRQMDKDRELSLKLKAGYESGSHNH